MWGNFDLARSRSVVGNEWRMDLRDEGDYPSQLFRNNGDGTFAHVAPIAGVTNDRFKGGGGGRLWRFDGDLDLSVSNARQTTLRNNGDEHSRT